MADKLTGLDLMRAPFPPHQVGKLAKGSKEQTKCPPAEKRNCAICGGWHHPKMIHLDYVGHAALTDRLLDCDPHWSWEPLALDSDGLPAFEASGGLWIKLTVCGVTRLGYGNAADSEYKEVGSRIKEVIGDCLRNSAMRFGAALELWHKGDLHGPDGDDPPSPQRQPTGVMGAVLAEAPPLDQGDLEYYVDLAERLTKTYNHLGPMKALELLKLEKLDNEQWLHLEARLDSKVRSGLKKAGELARAGKSDGG